MKRTSFLQAAIALITVSCATNPPGPAAPPSGASPTSSSAAAAPATPSATAQATPTPRPITCTAPLRESTSFGQPFPEALVRDGARCVEMMRVEERRCAGVYTAIAEGGGYGGNVRYFDLNRTLIAVTVRSDTNQFCNGSSFEIVYGTKPACPTAEVVTSLCRS